MPKGPISVVSITGDTPPSDTTVYELALKFKLRTYGGEKLRCEDFARILGYRMDDWCDGRRPFDVEMIRDGLFRCLKTTAYEVVCEDTQREFGRQVVSSEGGRRQTSRWYLEAQKRPQVIPDFYDSAQVELKEI